jgi:hypothetical protein
MMTAKFSFEIPPFVLNPMDTGLEIPNGPVHILSPAIKERSFVLYYLSTRGVPTNVIASYCENVNRLDEVGAFYPRAVYTIIPDNFQQGSELANHLGPYFKDILIAHLVYYKQCNTMLFVFDATSSYPSNLEELRKGLEDGLRSFLENQINALSEEAGISVWSIMEKLSNTKMLCYLYSDND